MFVRIPFTRTTINVTERGINVMLPEQSGSGRNAGSSAPAGPAPTDRRAGLVRKHPTVLQQALNDRLRGWPPAEPEMPAVKRSSRKLRKKRPEAGLGHARAADRTPNAGPLQMPSAYARYRHRLNAWVNAAADPREYGVRQQAARQADGWLRLRLADQRWNESLALHGLGLSDMPPLPEGVQHVDLGRNRMTLLTGLQHLPKSLKRLNLAGNPLMDIDPEGIVTSNRRTRVDLGITRLPKPARRILDRIAPNVTHARAGAQMHAGPTPAAAAGPSPSLSARDPDRQALEDLARWVQQADDATVANRLAIYESARLAQLARLAAAAPAPVPEPVPVPEILLHAASSASSIRTALTQRQQRQPLPQNDLDRWVTEAGDGELEVRQHAKSLIEYWQKDMLARRAAPVPMPMPALDLTDAELTSLPPLPEGVQVVDFRGNRLSGLSELDRLPASVNLFMLDQQQIASVAPENIVKLNRPGLTLHLGTLDLEPKDLDKLEGIKSGSQVKIEYVTRSVAPRREAIPAAGTGRPRTHDRGRSGTPSWLSSRFENSDAASVRSSRSSVASAASSDLSDSERLLSEWSGAGDRGSSSRSSSLSSRSDAFFAASSSQRLLARPASHSNESLTRASLPGLSQATPDVLSGRLGKASDGKRISSDSAIASLPATGLARSLTTFEGHLKQWASSAPGELEARSRAESTILAWIGRNNNGVSSARDGNAVEADLLDLSSQDGMTFSAMPPLPAQVTTLAVRNQGMVNVALGSLPESLRSLDLTGNPLKDIDDSNLPESFKDLRVTIGTTALPGRVVRRLNETSVAGFSIDQPGISEGRYQNKWDSYKDEWKAIRDRLQQWVEAGAADQEGRRLAVQELEEWLHQDDGRPLDAPLDFSRLNLEQLPPVWPDVKIEFIQAQGNRLREIPVSSLPSSLKFLNLKDNQVSAMPAELTGEQMQARKRFRKDGATPPSRLVSEMNAGGWTLANPVPIDPREMESLTVILAGNPIGSDAQTVAEFENRKFGPKYVISHKRLQSFMATENGTPEAALLIEGKTKREPEPHASAYQLMDENPSAQHGELDAEP